MTDPIHAMEARTFESYVDEHADRLLRLAYVLTRDNELSQDLTQSALVKVWRNWPKIRKTQQPDAYVTRILVNAFLDHERSRHRRESLLGRLRLQRIASAEDPTAEIQAIDGFQSTLASLNERERTVLVLTFYLDQPDATIADSMGIAASSVRALRSRALSRLRASAADQLADTLGKAGEHARR